MLANLSASSRTIRRLTPIALYPCRYTSVSHLEATNIRRGRARTIMTEAASERAAELAESLSEIRARVKDATPSASASAPVLVAVSKYKPASDIQACYENGQLDFGENYVQELVEKAEALPRDIRWHFIGTLQSNKAKVLAAIPNLYSIQTLASVKAASLLEKALPDDRSAPLNVLLQVNTSGEDAKSGLPPLKSPEAAKDSELVQLARTLIQECPKIRLQGLMTIGALERSHEAAEGQENEDFETLKETRDVLVQVLENEFGSSHRAKWGQEGTGRLLLSMGMSSDFEAALKAGSDIVRVGTGIFGARKTKTG